MGLRRHDPVLPGLARRRHITLQLIRLTQQLPSRRILRILLHAARQVHRRFSAIALVQPGLAQAEPQQRVIHTLGQHLFQRFAHALFS
ncbi:hypothetical protein D3C81_2095610 [compost metagenome]